jgi:hypothetical protein
MVAAGRSRTDAVIERNWWSVTDQVNTLDPFGALELATSKSGATRTTASPVGSGQRRERQRITPWSAPAEFAERCHSSSPFWSQIAVRPRVTRCR